MGRFKDSFCFLEGRDSILLGKTDLKSKIIFLVFNLYREMTANLHSDLLRSELIEFQLVSLGFQDSMPLIHFMLLKFSVK